MLVTLKIQQNLKFRREIILFTTYFVAYQPVAQTVFHGQLNDGTDAWRRSDGRGR